MRDPTIAHTLTFDLVSSINLRRCDVWHPPGKE